MSQFKDWEIVLGLETHVQLSTRSKMFSGSSTDFGAAPNTQASAVDIALPGVLPVANRGAVECAIRFGLAVNGGRADNFNRRSVFARKNYFYPDLPKGYQISQLDLPIVKGGEVAIVSPTRGEIKVKLTRAHLEEDAGKSIHGGWGQGGFGTGGFGGISSNFTGIDLNRAGTPLLEIVSEPDMRSAEEAVAYARALHGLVTWIGICDGNMQEGSFRCDANVSVRRRGSETLGTRREIKNLNSFRFLQQAIEAEARWQIETIEDGGTIRQATVLFDADTGKTHAMRSKEDAHDYRYFPDPDLLPLVVSEKWIASVAKEMPELPSAMRDRLVRDFEISREEAVLLTATKTTANYFQDSTKRLMELNPAKWKGSGTDSKDSRVLYGGTIARGMAGLLAAQLNRDGIDIDQARVTSAQFALLHARLLDETLTPKSAREIFQSLWESSQSEEGIVDWLIESKGLKQISDSGAIEKIVDEVLAANAKQVEDYRAGKDKAFNSLVGQVMKASKGKANPAQVNEILKRKLAS